MRREIVFLRRGREVRLNDVGPTTTLLDHLRLTEGAVGTKEGCCEGDCGACTVVLRRKAGERLVYEPVNSCILLVGQADGTEVVTVEDLAEGDVLHPVQEAMVALHGSQCGFCTPGFVMSLFALWHAPSGDHASREAVCDQIAGNLCRCTGYRPIVDAGLTATADRRPDAFDASEPAVVQALARLDDDMDVFVGDESRFFAAPRSIGSLAALHLRHPDATLVAGATDVGLWITKQLRDLPKIIWLGRVRGLDAVTDVGDALEIGATATHAAAMPHLAGIDPDLGEIWRRFASVQVRNSGTVGGNIANGSPIGDGPPALIALGATLTLRRGDATRTIPLEDFFLAYGKQDRAPGEFVLSVHVPKLAANEQFRAFKISKRFDQDISAVMMGLKVALDGRRIASARIAFGGMAATPKRAFATEAALAGVDLDLPATWDVALTMLGSDYTPIDDLRASAAYRLDVAGGLVAKALHEIAGASSGETRVTGLREARDAA